MDQEKSDLESDIARRFQSVRMLLNERQRRLWAAAEAIRQGSGGISRVARAIGMSRMTIHSGLREIRERRTLQGNRVRREGGGRKKRVPAPVVHESHEKEVGDENSDTTPVRRGRIRR